MTRLTEIKHNAKYLFLVVLLAFSFIFCTSQERQSVGLVLSGGGAKGIAHIGVIQALEENDIPIDYVVGTSMGAIVGGLYSAGYSPQEMLELLLSEDFSQWSTGVIDKNKTYYYLQKEKTPAIMSFNVGRDSTATKNFLPSSFINPLPMNMGFLKLFTPHTAACQENFDKLFIPFRCVTSDVYNKHKVILSSGNLGDAIRMSMSFPIAFKPIEKDGLPMFDGGIYDNFPVDVMKETFAPDIIIGIDVTTHEPTDTKNLISQIETMIIQNENYELAEEDGIKLHVNLKGYGLLDFPKAQEIYDKGYATAMESIDSIKNRVQGRISAGTVALKRNIYKCSVPEAKFDPIHITGVSPNTQEYLEHFFLQKGKEIYTIDDIEDAYYRTITSGKIKDLVPETKYNKETEAFELILKTSIKNNFAVGIGGFATSSANSMLFLSGGYETMKLNSFSSHINGWIGQSYLGGLGDIKFSTSTKFPLTTKFQIAASKQEFHPDDALFFDNLPSYITKHQYYANAILETAAGRHGKAGLSIGYGYLKDHFYPDNTIQNDSRDEARYQLGKVTLSYTFNTLDNDFYPSSGKYFNASINGISGKSKYIANDEESIVFKQNYDRVTWAEFEVNGQAYINPVHKFALGFKWDALYSTKDLYKSYTATLIQAPAFTPTQSTKSEFIPAFRSNSFVTAGIIPIFKIMDNLQVRSEFYAFAPMRPISCDRRGYAYYKDWFSRYDYMGELALVYNFSFGSLSLYGNYISDPTQKWNFGVSFGFNITAPDFLR